MLKHNVNNIKELLMRFTEGQTTEAEEEVLKDYFTHSEHIPEEWEAYKDLFSSFDTDAYDFTQEEVDAMFVAEPAKKRTIWPWLVAACVIGTLIMFVTPPKFTTGTVDNAPIAEVMQKVPEVKKEQTKAITEPTPASVAPQKRKQNHKVTLKQEHPLEKAEATATSEMTMEEAEKYVEAMIAANMPDIDNIFNDPIEFQSMIRAKGMELSERAYKTINNQEL